MQVIPARGGWVEVVCGSMFSGKSEELLRRLRRAQIAGLKVAVYKPALDNRYSDEDVVSHNGNRIQGKPVPTAGEVLRLAGNADVVGIDEAQFFDDAIVDVVVRLADAGKRVVLACLDQDFRGEPFGPVPQLLARAEFVTKLQAICQQCGGPATRTQRLIEGQPACADEPVIKVGATESYEPRCRVCHELPAGTPAHLDDDEATAPAPPEPAGHRPLSGHVGRFAV